MEKELICQSCSMPLTNEDDKGTNIDGSTSQDYCKYCYEKGEFLSYSSLEEAIADSVNYADLAGVTKEEALAHAKEVLPTLKRWMCTCTDECAEGHNPNCTCDNTECHCRENSN